MEKSTSIANLAKALIAFHIKVGKINKDATNPFFKNKYASLSNILDGIDTPLIESGLCYLQFPSAVNGLTTILIHAETGEFVQDTYEMKPSKDDPQGRGSAITYQRRYALSAVLGLNIDEDDDANAASNPPQKAEVKTNGTTLHNHKELGTKDKPLISNIQFKKLVERVTGGDLAALEQALNYYTFEAKQKSILDQFKQPA